MNYENYGDWLKAVRKRNLQTVTDSGVVTAYLDFTVLGEWDTFILKGFLTGSTKKENKMSKKNKGAAVAVASPATEAALLRHPEPGDTLVGDASELNEIADTGATSEIKEAPKSRGRISSNPMRAVKVKLFGQEFEYRKPGKEGVVLADIKYISSHSSPSLVFEILGEEYIVN